MIECGVIHPHLLFDLLAYAGGFQLYRLTRRRANVPATTTAAGLWLLAGAIVGAAVGAKLLAWLEHPGVYLEPVTRGDLHAWLGGKTVVGGLLGGWVGVELAKRINGVTARTGDAFVLPLAFGIVVGRIGCFLTGLPDMTHGVATDLPWAVDFGDGVPRHPAQVYEMIAVALIVIALLPLRGRLAGGGLFRCFLGGYLLWRFGVEFIKPSPKGYAGLSAIQWASVIGAAACVWGVVRVQRGRSGSGPSLRSGRA